MTAKNCAKHLSVPSQLCGQWADHGCSGNASMFLPIIHKRMGIFSAPLRRGRKRWRCSRRLATDCRLDRSICN